MNSVLLGILFQVVAKLAGGDLFDLIKQFVLAEVSQDYKDIPATATTPALSANEQRKLSVKAKLYAIQGDLKTKVKSLGGFLLSIAIDAAVGKLQSIGILKK